MMISPAIKRQMHRDICADPVLHGEVLNLYLNGEQYPHRVADYFPLVDDIEPELAERMRAHMCDEDKHIALYQKAVRRIQQPIRELAMQDVFNHVIRSYTTDTFAFNDGDGEDTRRLKLGHFLAHLHFLETRVAQSLEYHLEGCEHSTSTYPSKVVKVILKDERKHASYTREAVYQLLPRALAESVLSAHQKAEGKANVDFSYRQFTRLLRDHRRRFPTSRRWLYRGAAFCLSQVMRYA